MVLTVFALPACARIVPMCEHGVVLLLGFDIFTVCVVLLLVKHFLFFMIGLVCYGC